MFSYISYADEREKSVSTAGKIWKLLANFCAAPKPRLCCLRSVILAWRSASAMAQIWNPSGMLLRAVNQNQRGKLFAKAKGKKPEFTFPFSGVESDYTLVRLSAPERERVSPDWKRIKNGKLKPHNVDGRINADLKGRNYKWTHVSMGYENNLVAAMAFSAWAWVKAVDNGDRWTKRAATL